MATPDHSASTRRTHLTALLYLVPVPVMLVMHRMLALSGAGLVIDGELDRRSQPFNLLLILVFCASATGFFIHGGTPHRPADQWLLLKVVIFAVYWFIVQSAMLRMP